MATMTIIKKESRIPRTIYLTRIQVDVIDALVEEGLFFSRSALFTAAVQFSVSPEFNVLEHDIPWNELERLRLGSINTKNLIESLEREKNENMSRKVTVSVSMSHMIIAILEKQMSNGCYENRCHAAREILQKFLIREVVLAGYIGRFLNESKKNTTDD